MAPRNLYLQLPPELGGVRFGPFPSHVTIGSDPKRSQVVLDPSMGIFPTHALLGRLGDGTISLSPGNKDAKVFLMPNGQPHVWPITSAVQVNLGDQIIVGTPAGPRFQLLGDQTLSAAPSAAQILSTAQKGGENSFVQSMSSAIDGVFRPAGGGISGELQRQLAARALARNPAIRDAYFLWTRFRNGSLFSPYMIVGMMFAVISMLGAGTFSCSGVMWVLWDVLGLRR
jgi:hypothetical protein